MRISGSGGRVRVGYQTAATLGPWTLTRLTSRPMPTFEATAAVTVCDAFWSRQGPQDVEFSIGSRVWAWAQVEPSLTAQSLTVRLSGAPSIH